MTTADLPRDARRAGVRDVAALAGVSTQTVSRVINDHPSVRDETRRRVQEAMLTLGYRVNNAARTLGTRRTRTLGVIASNAALFGPAAGVVALETAARAAGRWVTTAYADASDESSTAAALEHLLSQGVDGIVVVAPRVTTVETLLRQDAGLEQGRAEQGTAERTTDEQTAAEQTTVDQETVDQVTVAERTAPSRGGPAKRQAGVRVAALPTNGGVELQAQATELAVQHLIDLGHRRIARLGGPEDWLEEAARAGGFDRAMHRAGLSATARWAGDWSAASGAATAEPVAASVRSEGTTAVVVTNDQMALGLMSGLAARGLSVPDDVSVVGFDDNTDAAYYSPALTTVRVDIDGEARRCVAAVLDVDNVEVSVVPPRLVIRQSTAPPR
jgi:DNA-binding LacI/PurR family transcriptional regulator